MTYVILTERNKRSEPIDYAGSNFYSRGHGCHSALRYAQTFPSFDAAQDTVARIRHENPGMFVYAVPARALP